MVAAMDELEQKYLALVQRISGYPMCEEASARFLDLVEAIHRRERRALVDHSMRGQWDCATCRTVAVRNETLAS